MPPSADGADGERDAQRVAADVCDGPAAPPRHGALHVFAAQGGASRNAAAGRRSVRQCAVAVASPLLRLFRRAPAASIEALERSVWVNTDGAAAHHAGYASNKVATSKYNVVTFLPRFTFEMFSRVAYIYFVVQMALTWWPAVSPFDPWGSTIALSFVLAVSAVKALWEDSKRHRDDWATNARPTRVMCGDGAFRQVPWRRVRVGDIVMARDDEELPADLLLLFSGQDLGVCYVQTTNLDGETNLKIRSPVALAGTPAAHLAPATASDVVKLAAHIACEPPNANLHRFKGRVDVLERSHANDQQPLASLPLSMENILLRGCRLKNSNYVIGVALYAGGDTRIMKNARRAPYKAGAFDRFLNTQITVLILVQMALCAGMAAGAVQWRRSHLEHYYFEWQARTSNNYASDFLFGLFKWLTFWILFSYLVPLSLFVSLEIVKYLQGYFIQYDERMRDPSTGELALARNTNLNEDLGLVSYIFSDKTGTLTSNEMRLRLLVLGGETFGDPGFKLEHCGLAPELALPAFDARLAAALHDGDASCAALRHDAAEALTAVTVCHTLLVQPEAAAGPQRDACVPVYQGPSPDEVALVDGARRLGVRFSSRCASGVVVDFLGDTQSFDLLATLAFTSERQRMSTVVRRPDGRVTLFCKGADLAMLPLLAPARTAAEAEALRRTEQHLDELAVMGLRTLVYASRDLSEAEWAAWGGRYQAAVVALDAQLESELAAEMEAGMRLVCATGIEDKLQDGVPATIRTLLAAGIRVWVITGDKQQTAITIGAACGLLHNPDAVLLFNADSRLGAERRLAELQSLAASHASDSSDGARGPELVIDGATLTHVLADRALAHAFAVLGAGARAVVVCRASPRQKSAVVQLMQRHLRAEAARLDHAQLGRWWSPAFWAAALRRIHCRPAGRTLAIGDGANDVAMLQAADVGIGIAGKEGRQAVNNADYAIGQFRFLARLLLVHGTLSHYRLARLIKYSFAKNVTFSGLLTFYQFYSGYSGQALYDSISAGLFNVLLTSLPILIFALVDRPVSDAGLLAHPQLYNRSTSLSGRAFWKTICDSTVASAVCFFVPVYAVPLASGGPRNLANMLELGKVGYTAVLTTVSLDLLLVSRYLTALFLGILALSVAVWWPLLYIVPRMADVDEMIGMASALFPAAAFWLIVALCTVITGSYRLTWIAFNRYFRPSDFDILAEEEVLMKARADGSDPAGPVGGSDAVADDVPAAYSAAADV